MTYPWQGRRLPPSPRALEDAARDLGCEVAAFLAVWEVEARGRYYEPNGDVIDRFEPHHFPRELWGNIGFRPRKGQSPWRASIRQSTEAMFMRAYELDPHAAIMASSWGAPQTLASNHKAAGHETAEDMVRAYADSAQAQIDGFVSTLRAWGLDSKLRAHDWYGFARRYNGSGQPAHYAGMIEAAYRRYSGGQRSAQVLSVGDRGEAVKRLQRALQIEDDGAFGPQTKAAVENYQREHGLKVDGIVGNSTWTSLKTDRDVKPKTQEAAPSKTENVTGKVAGWTATVGGGAAVVQQASRAAESVNRVIPPEVAPILWVVAAVALAVVGIMYARRKLA